MEIGSFGHHWGDETLALLWCHVLTGAFPAPHMPSERESERQRQKGRNGWAGGHSFRIGRVEDLVYFVDQGLLRCNYGCPWNPYLDQETAQRVARVRATQQGSSREQRTDYLVPHRKEH